MGRRYAREWLTKQELTKLLSVPDITLEQEALILVMYGMALRVSEALRLRVSDFDFERRAVRIGIGKGGRRDVVLPVPNVVRKKVRQLIEVKNLGPRDRLFNYTRQGVYKLLNSLARKAGISKRLGTHSLRRSRAMHLLDDGVDLAVVSRFLRHRDVRTTMRYLDLSPEFIRRELERFDAFERVIL